MSHVIETLERRQLRTDVPKFKAGDTVRVHFQVIEGNRRRTQVFEGIVIKRQGTGVRETFTVRKQSFGVGVRSEEHTSELQSRQYLVCRLLLEKKQISDNWNIRTAPDSSHPTLR